MLTKALIATITFGTFVSAGVPPPAPINANHGWTSESTEASQHLNEFIEKHAARPYNASTDVPFDGSCTDVMINWPLTEGETSIQGRCSDEQGNKFDTEPNMNRCLVNNQGKLEYFDNSGLFDNSCGGCLLFISDAEASKLYFACSCYDEKHNLLGSVIEMGSQVDDELAIRSLEGMLVCGSHYGSKVSAIHGIP